MAQGPTRRARRSACEVPERGARREARDLHCAGVRPQRSVHVHDLQGCALPLSGSCRGEVGPALLDDGLGAHRARVENEGQQKVVELEQAGNDVANRGNIAMLFLDCRLFVRRNGSCTIAIMSEPSGGVLFAPAAGATS